MSKASKYRDAFFFAQYELKPKGWTAHKKPDGQEFSAEASVTPQGNLLVNGRAITEFDIGNFVDWVIDTFDPVLRKREDRAA